jgi:ribosome recycling factor
MMFDLNECKLLMEETIHAHESELRNIRTGRVSPDILKSIIVDSYGSKMPLTQLANINNLDNMTLSVSIWDNGLVKIAEKSILESNLGVTPQTDGNNLLLKFPELTSERRKELVKIINEYSEKYKISIRNIRRKSIDMVKNLEKEKSISIDESKKYNDDIQKLTDNFISQIDDNSAKKENEILQI